MCFLPTPNWKGEVAAAVNDLKVHVADSHKAEKRLLPDGLPSDFFSEGKCVMVSHEPQGLPEAEHAKFLKGCAG